jgi:hypothetical protein
MNVYNKPGEHIVYLDMNNLYGKAMMLSLPVAGYELDEKEYDSKDILDWILRYDFTRDRRGYILKCDIAPPDNKGYFNGYPLFPEKTDARLEATLLPRRHYLVHIAYLRVGLRLDYKLLKVHRMTSFYQRPIMRDNIEYNTNGRKNAKNRFMENYFKLMDNNLYGKTCENPLKIGIARY